MGPLAARKTVFMSSQEATRNFEESTEVTEQQCCIQTFDNAGHMYCTIRIANPPSPILNTILRIFRVSHLSACVECHVTYSSSSCVSGAEDTNSGNQLMY